MTDRRTFLAGAGAGVLGLAAAAPVAQAAAGREAPGWLGLTTTHVAGTHGKGEALARLSPGDPLTLMREPRNAYDPRTVAVGTAAGERLGTVPRAEAKPLASLMDAGVPVRAEVRAVRRDGVRPDVTFEVAVALAPHGA
ncbi:HIRAN domain-containing protein [Acuticoccus sp.]|uniref:HIRAN domain-containing protein n=1 Tax=Acuticoccus sp. TaxID=1904378 RepID=UPI003B528812